MTTATAPTDGWRRRDSRVSVDRALASTTRLDIYEQLRDDGAPHTVRDVASRFQLHPNVARTHLETLADAGLVAVGVRKRPGGGRPAKLYRALDEDADQPAVQTGDHAGAGLQIRLLAELADPDPAVAANDRPPDVRAHEVGTAEGRRLVRPHEPGEPATLAEAAEVVVRALRPHLPASRVVKAGDTRVDLTGTGPAFASLSATRPALAEAMQRGLLEGAFAAAGHTVTVSEAGLLPEGDQVWRARAAGEPGGGRGPRPAHRVDARGMPREHGVVRAMREVVRLRAGEVLEVIAEGPGSPAAFARWADRAGHELLGVERVVDRSGRPAIRLLIRKGGS